LGRLPGCQLQCRINQGDALPHTDAEFWDGCIEQAVTLRRELHRHPETAWEEHHTAERIRARLGELGIGCRACADTGTLAVLGAGRDGRHVALRADIDGLPIQEKSEKPWASMTEGRMHACGHDGHTATLLGVASWLKRNEDRLPGPVTLLFQPAEEGGHGAKKMIEDGALDGVDAIFGWHNWPAIPFGRALCPDGVVMAGNGTFAIEVTGAGGHASQPEACRDPVLAASAIVIALQQVVSRRTMPQRATVLSVTSFEAPSGATIIPDRARLGGSFRLADTSGTEALKDQVRAIAESTAQAYGVDCEVKFVPRYRATVNDPEAAGGYREAIRAELGDAAFDADIPIPVMASEDFSYYLHERPGAFALIGADDGNGSGIPCHSPRYDFNDALIEPVARIYARLAGAPFASIRNEVQ